MERWSLKLAPYDATVKHIPGATNPADYLSRHPLPIDANAVATKVAENHVDFITSSVSQHMSIEEVKAATATDDELQKVIKAIKSENWKDLKSSHFYKFLDVIMAATDDGCCTLQQEKINISFTFVSKKTSFFSGGLCRNAGH